MKNKTLQKIACYVKKYWFFLFLSLCFAAGTVAATLYIPILIGNAVDHIVTRGDVAFDKLWPILRQIVLFVGLAAAFQWLLNLSNNHIAYHVSNDIRRQAFQRLNHLPLSYVDGHGHGEVVSRITTDVDQFTDGLLLGFTQLFTGILTIAGTIGFMLSLNVIITLVVIIITPLSLFTASYIAKHTYSMFQAQSDIRAELTAHINEMVGGQKEVIAFSHQEESIKDFDSINERLEHASLFATFYSSISNPATRFVNALVYAGVGVAGAFLAISGHISVGGLTSFLSYANQYTKPFNEITGVITEFQNALASAGRVFALMDEEPEASDAGGIDDMTVKGQVSLSNVSFSYDKEKPFIKQLNLEVKPGQRVAIVGPTGCGKTTLINLFMRFYPIDDGSILLDGRNIEQLTRKNLRENFGMVLQETWLKKGTIFENIAFGKPEATKEEVILAAKAAYAHSFIKRLPNGYDTPIDEAGGNLSEGQKQLLCISRVMLLHPPVLILDEATSSIDTRTEVKVQKALDRLMEGRTCFIVAHRLSTIREADKILVMKAGAIIESGTHEELLEQGGFYKQIYNSQFEVLSI